MKLTRGGCIITKDRFKLEEDINNCWRVTDDVSDLTERLLDGYPGIPNLTQDQLANILIGITQLYDMKFQKLWDSFCQVCELDAYASADTPDPFNYEPEIDNEEDYDDLGNSYSVTINPR